MEQGGGILSLGKLKDKRRLSRNLMADSGNCYTLGLWLSENTDMQTTSHFRINGISISGEKFKLCLSTMRKYRA